MASFEFLYGESAEHFRFLRIPKKLLEDCEFRKLPHFLEDLIVYSEMLDLASLSKKKGMVDEENHVYIVCQNDQVKQWLDVGVNMPTKILSELEQFGLIKRRRRSQDSMYYVMDFASKLPDDSGENPVPKKPKNRKKAAPKVANHDIRDCNLQGTSITKNVNHEKRESRESCITKSVGVNHAKSDCQSRKAWITPSYTNIETNIETDFIDTPEKNVDEVDNQFFIAVRNAFIEECPSLKKPTAAELWSQKRKNLITDKHVTLDVFRKVFRKVEESDFLTGKKPSSTGTLFLADFGWVLQPDHWEGITEGKYDNRKKSKTDSPSYDLEAYEQESLDDMFGGELQQLSQWSGDDGSV